VMNRTRDRSTLPMPHTRVERDQEPREHTAETPTGARASLVVGRFLFLTRPSVSAASCFAPAPVSLLNGKEKRCVR
jgi:hypothetical protein